MESSPMRTLLEASVYFYEAGCVVKFGVIPRLTVMNSTHGWARPELRSSKIDFCIYGSGYLNTVFAFPPATLERRKEGSRQGADAIVAGVPSLPFPSLPLHFLRFPPDPTPSFNAVLLCKRQIPKVPAPSRMNDELEIRCARLYNRKRKGLVCFSRGPSLKMPDVRERKRYALAYCDHDLGLPR